MVHQVAWKRTILLHIADGQIPCSLIENWLITFFKVETANLFLKLNYNL